MQNPHFRRVLGKAGRRENPSNIHVIVREIVTGNPQHFPEGDTRHCAFEFECGAIHAKDEYGNNLLR
ncbi:hypothetical protein [Streptomyces sp. NPDC093089]|uniref:hypothetical protein n=1 Tax=Streptomyces sp. NPDC093089 TaxID=3366024 RepID=UPI0037F27B41